MRDRFKVAAAVVGVLIVSVLTVIAPGAEAQSTSCSNIPCVGQFLKTNPVYQDPKAEVKLTEAQQTELRNRIGTREPRVYIAILPLAAANANGGVNEVPGKIGQAIGLPASVGVIAGTNFRGRSGGGAPFETNQISKLATDAFERNNPGKNGGNVMPMLLSFIDGVHNAPQVQPTTAPRAGNNSGGATQTQFQPAKKKSNTGRNILLFLLFLLVLGAIIAAVMLMRSRRKFQDRKASVDTKVRGLQAAIFQAENGGDTYNTEARGHLARANRHYDSADTNLRANDLDDAERDLERGHDALASAVAMANMPEPPPPPPMEIPLKPVKRTTSKRGGGAKARRQEPVIERAEVDHEGRIVINNTVQQPRDRQDDGYDYYFPGGMYGGRYIYGGWYPMNFWDYMILDSIMDDRRDSHGHHHEDHGGSGGGSGDREAATVGGGSWDGGSGSTGDSGYEDSGSGGGDWGGGGGSTTGGGSWDSDVPSDPPSAPEPEPVSSGGGWGSSSDDDSSSRPAPVYSPPPSYDPPDTGGWGGGGGDTSGGGGWGGGDTGGGGGGGDSGGGGW